MRRTKALQGVRLIKFRGVLDRYQSSELNQMEAANLLGICKRAFRRSRPQLHDGDAAFENVALLRVALRAPRPDAGP